MSHRHYEELAAGYALDALEPQEEHAFHNHLRHCGQCAQLLRNNERTVARFAETIPEYTPPARLRAELLAKIEHMPRGENPAPVPIAERHPKRARLVLVAAAVAIAAVIGLGVRAGQLGNERDVQATQAAGIQSVLEQATRQGAKLVEMSPPNTNHPVAILAANKNTVTVMPTEMDSTPAGSTYVVWGLDGAHPLALGTFDYNANSPRPRSISLPASAVGTTSFGISLEPGETAPAQPSNVLGTGAESS